MNYKCPVHLTPLSNAVVCQVCIDTLARDLGDIASLAVELETTSTRQGVSGQRNGSRSTSPALPFDWSADHDLDDLNATLVGWVRELVRDGEDWPERGENITQQCASMSRWLLVRCDRIAQHLAADEICDEISYAVRQSYRAIDHHADRWYAGPCRSEYVVDQDSTEGNDACCLADLYAKPGAETFTCRQCGTLHVAQQRRSWLLAAAEDTLATATTIARAVTVLRQHVTPERIRQWAHRGRLAAKGIDHRGHPTYRVGDVIDRLQEDIESAERRSARRGAAA